MRLTLKLKDGRNFPFNEQQSDIIARNINYIKLAQFLLSDKKPTKGSIVVLNQRVEIDKIKSIEFFL
jgi:hypothetical protein